MKIEKVVVHYVGGETSVTYPDKLTLWIDKNIFIDSETKERRDIILDTDRNMLFFFSEELDFDKDDKLVARYWLNEIEDYQDEWFEDIKSRYTK